MQAMRKIVVFMFRTQNVPKHNIRQCENKSKKASIYNQSIVE
jgi:hypothetical protein